jgi:hypothetical protein
MRSLRITIGLATVACTVAAFATPALAAKEKIVFGEFEASITGQNLETTPGVLKVNKEGEIALEGLELGPYIFGPKNPKTGEQEITNPCKSIKLKGLVAKEKSPELTFKLKFSNCTGFAEAGQAQQAVFTSFELGVNLKQNFSAEIGKSESSLEIEPGVVKFKGPLKKCPVVIPRQTIPAKDNLEKEFEEIVEFENEAEAPEGIEHSKKLKELYPSGEKEFLNIFFLERFKHIHTYFSQEGPCTNAKGESNPRVVTEEGPFKGWLEYSSGHMFGEILRLEIKDGNLKFKEP